MKYYFIQEEICAITKWLQEYDTASTVDPHSVIVNPSIEAYNFELKSALYFL
jgi:hypothetical protein